MCVCVCGGVHINSFRLSAKAAILEKMGESQEIYARNEEGIPCLVYAKLYFHSTVVMDNKDGTTKHTDASKKYCLHTASSTFSCKYIEYTAFTVHIMGAL